MGNSKISKHEYGDIESRRERKRKRIKERNPEIERKTEKNHQHQFFQLVGAEKVEQAQSKGVWALRKAEQPKLIKSTYLQQGFKKGFSNIASVLFLFEIALLLVLYITPKKPKLIQRSQLLQFSRGVNFLTSGWFRCLPVIHHILWFPNPSKLQDRLLSFLLKQTNWN